MTYAIQNGSLDVGAFSYRDLGYIPGVTPASILAGTESGQTLALPAVEASGATLFDMTSYERNGTIAGTAPSWTTHTSGFACVSMNGTNNVITTAATASLIPDVGSWYMGILFKRFGLGVAEYLIAQKPSTSDRYYLRITTANEFEFVVQKSNASLLSGAAHGGSVGVGWHLVMVERRHNPGTDSYYPTGHVEGFLNGTSVFTVVPTTSAGFAPPTSAVIIGGDSVNASQYLAGEFGCAFVVAGQSLGRDGAARLARHFDNALKLAGQGGLAS